MKKIFLALVVSLMITGAGYCAPKHGSPHQHRDEIAPPPPPPVEYNIVRVRRHKHHVPLYNYDYPVGTQVIINTGGFSVGYGINSYGGGYVTYGGGFRL